MHIDTCGLFQPWCFAIHRQAGRASQAEKELCPDLRCCEDAYSSSSWATWSSSHARRSMSGAKQASVTFREQVAKKVQLRR